MNVAIDLGNTRIKIGIFDGQELRQKRVIEKTEDLADALKNFSSGNIIISSVNADPREVALWAKGFERVFIMTSTLPVPIRIHYTTPQTLGVDRIAATVGAFDLFPGRDCLIINCGTCVTYDFLDRQSLYLGGGISPGLKMRFKAMHEHTARLPLVSPLDNPPLVGADTISCMQSGVVWGMVEEIDGIIRRYEEKFPDLQVILTGGDSQFFENKLKASIFAGPELVLRGLNRILLYNIRA
jgi:type III pantothenate kinase